MRVAVFTFCVVISQMNVHDTWAGTGDELFRIIAPEGGPLFASSVDIDEDILAVGTGGFLPFEAERGPQSTEAVYLFDLANQGQLLHTLRSDSPNDGDWFGNSVAVDGNLLVVGASFEDSIEEDSGAVYLFDVTTGERLFKFLPAEESTDGRYGSNLAIGGNYVAISMRSLAQQEAGPRFINVYDTNTGSLVHRLTEENRGFGTSVAIDGDVIIVGGTSPVVPQGGGSVYAFDLNSGEKLWEYTSDDRSDAFGSAVDISRDRVIVGASGAKRQMGPVPARFSGAAYILDASTGELLHELEPRRAYLQQEFGSAVAIEGNIALVGIPSDDRETLGGPGAVSVFDVTTGERINHIWGDEISDPPLTGQLTFGSSIALSGTRAAVGSPFVDLAHVIDLSVDVVLQAGDADQDLDFDQLDLVQVQVANEYLSGETATWGEGDWNGAPGGSPGDPPAGDGVFDQLDVIAALNAGTYLTGPYAAIRPDGQLSDSQTSIIYDETTGSLSVDAPAGAELTSINIQSASAIFTESPAEHLEGAFDNDADDNIFKATFGGSFGSLSFGQVAAPGLSREFLLDDLTVQGSLAGGGELGEVDLIFVPEPSAISLLGFAIATIIVSAGGRRTRHR